jgi:hypothetical protein
MADLTLATAGKVNVGSSGPNITATAPAATAITAGAPVFYDANGKFAVADANAAAADACYGIATRSVAAGEALTALRSGLMDGWSDLPVPGAAVYVSDTIGLLGTTVGTATIMVGIVEAVWGTNIGTAADRVLRVECTGRIASAA